MNRTRIFLSALLLLIAANCAWSQRGMAPFDIHHGDAVPRDVRELYEQGLGYLSDTQTEKGIWQGGQTGAGVTGMALMTFLASGEDPNFGKYSQQVKKAVKGLVDAQDQKTGYFGGSMYHHGFGMLGLAEAYGAVDDRRIWSLNSKKSIAKSLELAVRCAITSQKKNSVGGWRYSPEASDADTSVSGAVLVGLLAARNAGIEVPDKSIDRAIKYYQSMTSDAGMVGYSGGMGGMGESLARSSIAGLVFAIARRKDLKQFKNTVNYLAGEVESDASGHYQSYTRYYQAQALFQGDMDAWAKWNKLLIERLKASQGEDGSFTGPFGKPADTSLSLLSLALNYRFLPIYER